MSQPPEFTAKRKLVVDWLAERGADAVLLASTPNLYWLALGGEVRRPTSNTVGFVVTSDRCYLVCPAEDADRVRQEEVRGLELEIVPLAWLGPEALVERVRPLLPQSARWCCDQPGLGFEHDPTCDTLRRTLAPEEVERLRKLGHDAATALEDVAAECFRGILERDAAARLAAECVRRQIVPVSILAGADDRLQAYARPLPKSGVAEHILLLSLVGMRGGLHVVLSRTVCLARPEERVVQRFSGALELAARLCHAARPGTLLGAAVTRALPEIAAGSLGGLVGYAVPEVEARTSSDWRLAASQALAWCIAEPGVRCEDTYILTDAGCEILTSSEGWPRRKLHQDGRTYEIPDLLLL